MDNGFDPAQSDADNDDLPDYWEAFYDTNPRKADSDGDGFANAVECPALASVDEMGNLTNPIGSTLLIPMAAKPLTFLILITMAMAYQTGLTPPHVLRVAPHVSHQYVIASAIAVAVGVPYSR